MVFRVWFSPVFVLAGIAAVSAADDTKTSYPQTTRMEHFDDYHGVKVADPYRWLEEDVRKSKEVAAWVKAENEVTFEYLKSIPERDGIRKRLTELWNYERYTAPHKVAGKYYFSKNNGLQNQSVLYVADTPDGPPRVVLDPNTWSKDGTVALAGAAFSDDGKYLAYSVAEAGSDWQTWRVLNLTTGKPLDDQVKWVKYSSTSWTLDGKGFFYSRYDEPKQDAGQFHSLTFNQKVYYHRVGTPQADDVLVHQRPDHPDWGFSAGVTEDGRYLILTTHVGTAHKYRIAYKDLAEPYGAIVDLVDNFENEYSFAGNDGPILYFKTDLDAPRGRLIAIDLRKPKKADWQEIIPQSREALTSVNLVGNLLVADYLKDAKTQVKMYNLDGAFVREVEFPGIGTAGGFAGKRTDTETFYSFSSYATPPTLYRYDMLSGKSTIFRRANVKFDPEQYEVKQVFYSSKDGTRVPMFITHRKGLKLDGSNPTLLYGYGGFAIPMTPRFSVAYVSWLEMGGVFAVANLRGGSEYGEEWHQGGTKLHKQNVFDDFIAAAEWLIANQYTSTPKLAIQGGSNGGLLVGACLTQRPELYGACLPAVGVMDMLRFHKFTAGRFWTDDYGSADNPEEFKALRAYSPYHNIKEGVAYPPTLVTTADTDDRVVP
ncbi:MAG TPA: prolyl oligopeptidase family serine peptidase, partial [Gemmataceae bacterium]|nr:prolyl oligopeptidase family serine peptidase [Gemmataceae bacterium]